MRPHEVKGALIMCAARWKDYPVIQAVSAHPSGQFAGPMSVLSSIAQKLGAKPSQVAPAWVLKRSPVMLPLPGTSRPDHVAENIAAAALTLSDQDFAALDEQDRKAA